jgi:hypothetical protein
MSTTTPNFGWTIPSDTDLVTDGAAAMRDLGDGIDTSFVDLNGGTTGQILSKTSATDLDFTWITNDVGDITSVGVTSPITGGGSSGAVTIAIQDALTTQKGAVQLSDSTSTTSSILAATPTAVKSAYDLANGAIAKTLTTTTGDTIYASAANTPARLGIGTAGQVLTVASGIPSWATPSAGTSGLNLISTTAITGASTYSFNSCFTSTYTNYLVILNSTTNVQFNNIFMRMRAAGTDNTSSNYKWAGYYQPFLSTAAITPQNSNGLNGDGLRLGSFGGANGFTHVQVYSPQASEVTSSLSFNTNNYGTNDGYTSQAISAMSVSTSYDGFTIYASSAGNFAGTVSIYGYGK